MAGEWTMHVAENDQHHCFDGCAMVAGFLSHVTRVYNNEVSFFFRPPQINWENQVVVITGGENGV